MKLNLTTEEMLLLQVMKEGCINIKLSKQGELIIDPGSPPDYLVTRKIKRINVQEALKRLLEARIWYLWENNQLYILEPPKVKIMPLSISAERLDPKGNLVVSVEGVEHTGYKEIAKAIFGGYHKDMLPELSPYLRDGFDLDEVVLQKMRTIKGNLVPVYRWRGYDLTGMSNVKKKLFWLTEEDITKLSGLITDHKQSLTEKRSDQLVRLFDLTKEDDGKYWITNPEDQREELTFTSKKKVLEYIRGHKLGGSVSRDTAKQMFEKVEEEK